MARGGRTKVGNSRAAGVLTARGAKAAKTSAECADKGLRVLVDRWLDDHPGAIRGLRAKISTGEISDETLADSATQSDMWPSALQTWDQIDKEWLVSLLSSLSGTPSGTFDLIDGQDGRALKKLLVLWCGVNVKHQLPKECRSKRVTAIFLEMRHEELGKRGESFSSHVDAQGTVNWPKVSPWKFEWSENKVCAVSHSLCGKVVVPGSLCLDESWSFQDLHDDLHAKVVSEIGVPVHLSQLLVAKADGDLDKLELFKEKATAATAKKAEGRFNAAAGKAVGSGSDKVLKVRAEKAKAKQQARMREAKTKPGLSLRLTRKAAQ